jgi:asparagine synthase (glutamine-hydrolysing)
MCGIAGILSPQVGKSIAVRAMVSRLIHRGPDADGYWEKGDYAAGMRRLSINDVEGGGQPLFDASNRIVLFYNGEIYNSPQLRESLIAEGYPFRTRSDGEVICHLYRKFGRNFFSRLDGMFAIALWDDDKQTLILGRDFPGEKPLYYAQLPSGGLAFASEITALMASGCVPREFDEQSIWDFPSFLWIPEPATIYQHVRAVLPGECIVARADGRIESLSFVKEIPREPPPTPGVISEAVREVKRVVTEAVKSRLLSDVPLGAFLSGGLDSSIVCTIARRTLPQLKTFCVGFENVSDPYHGYSDESNHAEAYAAHLGCEHTTLRVNAQDFRVLLPQLLKSAGQPYAVSSGLGILAIAREAQARGIKVLLSGDGADEAFGGYSWYAEIPRMCNAIPQPTSLARFFDGGDDWNAKAARMASYSDAERAWAYHYYASEAEKASLFGEAIRRRETSLRWFDRVAFNQPLDYLRHDRAFYFPNEMLSKVDRMTMAYSVEGRAPFAAFGVQFLSGNLAWSDLVRGDQLKWVLREAFRDELPLELVNRKKHGFNVPIDHWLKNDWRDLFEETFMPHSCLVKSGILHRNARQRALAILNDPRKIAGHVIFPFIMLNLWMTEYENGSYC